MSLPRWIAQFPARIPATTPHPRILTQMQLCSCLELSAAVCGTAVPVDGMVLTHFVLERCCCGGKASCSKVNDTMMGCFKTERGDGITRRVMRLSNQENVDKVCICNVLYRCVRY